jgi:PHS family inorganic phosphate transporter-like MFS transporter
MENLEKYLDEAKLDKYHFKAMFVSGMGFFTDAYDLFIIGIALSIIAPLWKLTPSQIGIIGSTSLVSAFLGSFVFGRIADKFGRKKVYGIEAMIMTVGALLSAVAPNFGWLVFFRFLLGVGIGGDYPVSAVIMSEYSNKKDRGKLVGLVFSMQAIGLIVGPLVALLLISLSLPLDLSWRLMLAVGAIPSMMVIYLRRKIPESPRYTAQVLGDVENAAKAIKDLRGVQVEAKSVIKTDKQKASLKDFFKNKSYMLTLLGTAGSWFLLDYAYYGNTISTSFIINSISPNMSLLSKIWSSFLVFSVFALPGYIFAILFMDKLGRKTIQLIGFTIMGITFLIIGLFPEVMQNFTLFLALYGMSYFFTEFGPNTTTFVIPSELFPTEYRATGHGFSAGIAKVGAFLGVLLFPLINHALGINGTFVLVSVFAFAGIITTAILPESKGKSLEDISQIISLKKAS